MFKVHYNKLYSTSCLCQPIVRLLAIHVQCNIKWIIKRSTKYTI